MRAIKKNSGKAANGLIAGTLALLLAVPVSGMPAAAQQAAGQNAAPAAQQSAEPAAQEQNIPPAPQPQPAQNSAGQNGTPAAVGTAAAPAETNAGAAASRPAGAAIAPARQRRRHALLIRMGIVVGAGVAIGAVALLAHSSASEPPAVQTSGGRR